MLTRRKFSICATCGLSTFVATPALAEPPPPGANGLSRRVLSQIDGPRDGQVTICVEVEMQPGAFLGWHTHPGIENGYLISGDATLSVAGQADRRLAPGEAFQVAPETPHALRNGPTVLKAVAVYIVDKGKPLVSSAPQ